jgi:hypothetical protein
MATNPPIDRSNIRPEQAEDVAKMNNISVDDAYARISRAQASQAGQMRGEEGTFYNPATGQRGTDAFTIGRDPAYWGQQGTSSRAVGTNQEGTADLPGASTASGGATIGSLYGASSGSALDAYGRRLSDLSKPVDEEKIRQDAINRVQSEIDAMNRFYAEKTRQEQGEARQVGESRLGQNAAISARRGMIGSDFGAARTSTIEQANARVQNDIYELNNAKRLAEQSALMGRANAAADAEITKKQAQLNESLQASIQLQEAQRQRAEKAADTRIAGLIAQGVEPSEADYDALAAQFGIDKETLKAKYAVSLPGAEKPIEVGGVLYQKQADGSYKPLTPGKEAAGQGLMEISPGASLYDPATGKFIGTAPATERTTSASPTIRDFADGTTRQYNAATGEWDILATKPGTSTSASGSDGGVISSVTGKPLTEAERTARGYLQRLEDATSVFERTADGIAALSPARYAVEQRLPSGLKSDVVQQQEQAERNFINAVLRRESGAAIADSEFDSARKQYFPQPGDSAAVLAQKKQNRATVMEGLRLSAGQGTQPTTQTARTQPPVNVRDVERVIGMSLSQDKRNDVEQALQEAPLLTAEEVAGLLGFKPVGGDTKPAVPVKKTGMRTDRHNNPTAFTTDIARIAGLREGVDYEKGDPFDNGRFHTARLLGDPVATTIKVIDNIGFYTQGGKQRWSHTAISQDRWNAMTYEQKKQVVKKMYGHEGGKELTKIFT